MPEEVKKYASLMKKLHEISVAEEREHAFFFCRTPEGELVASPTFPGGAHYVRVPERDVCEAVGLGKEEGMFHTHPSELSLAQPAPPDLAFSIIRGHKYTCVSGNVPRAVACWEINPDTPESKEYAEMVKAAMECREEVAKKIKEPQDIVRYFDELCACQEIEDRARELLERAGERIAKLAWWKPLEEIESL